MTLEGKSAIGKNLLALLAYPISMAVLSAALELLLHEFGSSSFATPLRFGFNAIAFPFVLGVVIQRILAERRLLQLWPIALGPFIYLIARLSLDEVETTWLADQLAELLAVAAFSAVVAVFGACIGSRISK